MQERNEGRRVDAHGMSGLDACGDGLLDQDLVQCLDGLGTDGSDIFLHACALGPASADVEQAEGAVGGRERTGEGTQLRGK